MVTTRPLQALLAHSGCLLFVLMSDWTNDSTSGFHVHGTFFVGTLPTERFLPAWSSRGSVTLHGSCHLSHASSESSTVVIFRGSFSSVPIPVSERTNKSLNYTGYQEYSEPSLTFATTRKASTNFGTCLAILMCAPSTDSTTSVSRKEVVSVPSKSVHMSLPSLCCRKTLRKTLLLHCFHK